jgi:hypothetical protein
VSGILKGDREEVKMRKDLFFMYPALLVSILIIVCSGLNGFTPIQIGMVADNSKGMNDSQDYRDLLKNPEGKYSKHGWNHYGPGYFELDKTEGVLKSQDGSGLFWYSVKKFKDFVLELDYRCEQKNSNSGVFLRVPEVPISEDFIYHSFEIQIDDSGEGIHKTGGVYDAEAPMKDVSKSPGEWNHLKITFRGNHLQVEHNGELILDWDAEPRGKVKSFASEGYIGIQNHDSRSSVYFKNIRVREL